MSPLIESALRICGQETYGQSTPNDFDQWFANHIPTNESVALVGDTKASFAEWLKTNKIAGTLLPSIKKNDVYAVGIVKYQTTLNTASIANQNIFHSQIYETLFGHPVAEIQDTNLPSRSLWISHRSDAWSAIDEICSNLQPSNNYLPFVAINNNFGASWEESITLEFAQKTIDKVRIIIDVSLVGSGTLPATDKQPIYVVPQNYVMWITDIRAPQNPILQWER